MRPIALIALLSAAGLIACNKNPLDPTQTAGVVGTSHGGTSSPVGAASPGSTATAPDSLTSPDTSGDCVQTGENQGQCGSQAADSTESQGSESETPGVEALRMTTAAAVASTGAWKPKGYESHEKEYGSEKEKEYGSEQEKDYGSQQDQSGYGSQQQQGY